MGWRFHELCWHLHRATAERAWMSTSEASDRLMARGSLRAAIATIRQMSDLQIVRVTSRRRRSIRSSTREYLAARWRRRRRRDPPWRPGDPGRAGRLGGCDTGTPSDATAGELPARYDPHGRPCGKAATPASPSCSRRATAARSTWRGSSTRERSRSLRSRAGCTAIRSSLPRLSRCAPCASTRTTSISCASCSSVTRPTRRSRLLRRADRESRRGRRRRPTRPRPRCCRRPTACRGRRSSRPARTRRRSSSLRRVPQPVERGERSSVVRRVDTQVDQRPKAGVLDAVSHAADRPGYQHHDVELPERRDELRQPLYGRTDQSRRGNRGGRNAPEQQVRGSDHPDRPGSEHEAEGELADAERVGRVR